jgi:hypothetical protein
MIDSEKQEIVDRIESLEAEIARLKKKLLDAGIVLTQPEHERPSWKLSGRRIDSSTSNDNESTIPEHFD